VLTGVGAAATASPTKGVQPTGTLDILTDPSPPPRTRYKVEYHGGPVLTDAAPNLYLIFYGGWRADLQDTTVQILNDLAITIGGSPYFSTVASYPNASGQRPSGGIIYGGFLVDAYSHGTVLSDADIADILRYQFSEFQLPMDAKGIYVVVASPDVWASSGQGESYCAKHFVSRVWGWEFATAYIGAPARDPSRCAPQAVGPNGTLGGDATALLLAAELFAVVTDPKLSAWYDRLGLEGADKCAWTYGQTYRTANGALANVRLGSRDYLLQQLWVPSKTGGACALRP
jgi:hypothetical protein